MKVIEQVLQDKVVDVICDICGKSCSSATDMTNSYVGFFYLGRRKTPIFRRNVCSVTIEVQHPKPWQPTTPEQRNRRGESPELPNPESLLDQSRNEIARVAQIVVDQWEVDEDGVDDVYGGGGCCDEVAKEISDVLANQGFSLVDGGQDGDDHAYVIAHNGDEAFAVDIHPEVYETGGGYSWTKIPGAKIDPADVMIDRMDWILEDMLEDERDEAREKWRQQHTPRECRGFTPPPDENKKSD